MFQTFRNQKRIWALLAMILVIPAFVFIGINGYSRLNPDANAIAKVDGKGIQPEEFDQTKREYIENMRRQQQGGVIDTSIFDTPEANAAILQTIATKRALQAQLNHNFMNIGEADAIGYIKAAQIFQKDGKFSPELYENYLAARGKSDQQFVFELRADLAREMLVNSVSHTVMMPKKTLELLNNILREEREVRTISFDPASYMKDVKVSEESMKKYYEENKNQFQAPETIDIEYVVMSPKTMKVTAQPSEDELKQFYEQNKSKYAEAEMRRASHILIIPKADAEDKAKADEEAKAKAQKLFEEVKANPEKFAELAKANSEDSGSAAYGGDLDFFSRGQMVEPFDKAVFEGKKGDIVGPVKSEFGYHVIHITDVHDARTKSYEEVRPEILALWQNQQRQGLFAENADNFTNMVYEQSDSLAPVVEKFGLELHKLDGVTANGLPPDSEAAEFINKRVIEELFAPDSLQDKRNTQATEVAINTLVSARVTKHIPAHLRTFEEVQSQIKDFLELKQASELAMKAGEEKLKALKEKSDLEGFGKTLVISRMNPQSQPIALVQAEMELPSKSLPAYTGAQAPDGTYFVSYVEKSIMPKDDDEPFSELRASAIKAASQADELAYYDALKQLYKMEILKKEFDYHGPKALN